MPNERRSKLVFALNDDLRACKETTFRTIQESSHTSKSRSKWISFRQASNQRGSKLVEWQLEKYLFQKGEQGRLKSCGGDKRRNCGPLHLCKDIIETHPADLGRINRINWSIHQVFAFFAGGILSVPPPC